VLVVPAAIATIIIEHAADVAPEECCGLLAVDDAGAVVWAYPVVNVDRSPVRYTVDPDGHFAALRVAESEGWSLGGVYHSHPRSAAVPSRSDVAGALDADWVHLIVSLAGAAPELRAWRIVGSQLVEVAMLIGDGQ
jgi:proteasome lid subunit RPN8/RPN11